MIVVIHYNVEPFRYKVEVIYSMIAVIHYDVEPFHYIVEVFHSMIVVNYYNVEPFYYNVEVFYSMIAIIYYDVNPFTKLSDYLTTPSLSTFNFINFSPKKPEAPLPTFSNKHKLVPGDESHYLKSRKYFPISCLHIAQRIVFCRGIW